MAFNATMSTKGIEKYLDLVEEVRAAFPSNVGESLLEGAEVVRAEMQELVRKRTLNLHDHLKIKGPVYEGTFIYVEIGLIHDAAYTDADTMRYGLVIELGSSSVKPVSYIRAGVQKSQAAWRKTVISGLKQRSGVEFQ